MDPELFQALFGGMGGGAPGAMVPPPGMLGGMTAPQGFGDAAALTAAGPQMMPKPVEPYMTDPLATGAPPAPAPVPMPMPRPELAQPASLGAVLDPTAGVPLPRPRPAEAGPGAVTPPLKDFELAKAKGITDALKGVVAPPAPQAQKVSTPHAPAMAKLQGGNVAELLAQLGIGPQQAFPGLKLPSTLGQALSGR